MKAVVQGQGGLNLGGGIAHGQNDINTSVLVLMLMLMLVFQRHEHFVHAKGTQQDTVFWAITQGVFTHKAVKTM